MMSKIRDIMLIITAIGAMLFAVSSAIAAAALPLVIVIGGIWAAVTYL